MKWVNKSLVGLAASSVCMSPVDAQQPLPRVELGAQPEDAASEKEVTLAADGTFRAAVLTRSGELVPGARLTFTPKQPSTVPVINVTTGPAGITVVTGTKAGPYDVHIEALQGAYNGTLRVKTFAEIQQT